MNRFPPVINNDNREKSVYGFVLKQALALE